MASASVTWLQTAVGAMLLGTMLLQGFIIRRQYLTAKLLQQHAAAMEFLWKERFAAIPWTRDRGA